MLKLLIVIHLLSTFIYGQEKIKEKEKEKIHENVYNYF